MKYMIIYKYDSGDKRIVGFANSIQEFINANNEKTYPYSYKEENISTYELHTDVFSGARIEGQSNFADYIR
jgi:hypothetical protein